MDFPSQFSFQNISRKIKTTKKREFEGIAIGMCMGVGLGTMFEGGLAPGVSIGVLLGLCIFHTEHKLKTILLTDVFCLLTLIFALINGTQNGLSVALWIWADRKR